MSFDTRIQQKISKYRQANPKLKTLSDKQILSILVSRLGIPAQHKTLSTLRLFVFIL